jgi:hypothetical protein
MMFHVKLYSKTLLYKGFFLFLILFLVEGCSTPRQAVDVSNYVLRENGKPILGHENGLTAFIFENNPRKIPFQQFIADKFQLGNSADVEFYTMVDGKRFKVLLYDNAELEKYFQTSDFIAANVEPDVNVVGSKAKFLALSVINDYNEDCLADGSLYQNMIIKYLLSLKQEYYNL